MKPQEWSNVRTSIYLQGDLTGSAKSTFIARYPKGIHQVLRQPERHHLWNCQSQPLQSFLRSDYRLDTASHACITAVSLLDSSNATCSPSSAQIQLAGQKGKRSLAPGTATVPSSNTCVSQSPLLMIRQSTDQIAVNATRTGCRLPTLQTDKLVQSKSCDLHC